MMKRQGIHKEIKEIDNANRWRKFYIYKPYFYFNTSFQSQLEFIAGIVKKKYASFQCCIDSRHTLVSFHTFLGLSYSNNISEHIQKILNEPLKVKLMLTKVTLMTHYHIEQCTSACSAQRCVHSCHSCSSSTVQAGMFKVAERETFNNHKLPGSSFQRALCQAKYECGTFSYSVLKIIHFFV